MNFQYRHFIKNTKDSVSSKQDREKETDVKKGGDRATLSFTMTAVVDILHPAVHLTEP